MRGPRALLVIVAAVAALTAVAVPVIPIMTSATASDRAVRVPRLVGTFVDQGYARLRMDGLRVTIPRGFVVDSLAGGGEIQATSPSAGRRAAVGSTVSLTIGCRCGLGSPAVPSHTPAYRVPEFVGRPLSAVLRWIAPRTLYVTERFGPLHRAAAARFSDNYRVVGQHPPPGATLRLGIGHKIGRNSGSFLPTPLRVRLAQNRRASSAIAFAGATTAMHRRPALTGGIRLEDRDVRAGGTVRGALVFENHTSRTRVLIRGCKIDGLYAIGFRAADGYLQEPAFASVACPEQTMVARPGTTVYRFRVPATYIHCVQSAAHQPPRSSKEWAPLCLKDSRGERDVMPPLPAGEYTTLFFPNGESHDLHVKPADLIVTSAR